MEGNEKSDRRLDAKETPAHLRPVPPVSSVEKIRLQKAVAIALLQKDIDEQVVRGEMDPLQAALLQKEFARVSGASEDANRS